MRDNPKKVIANICKLDARPPTNATGVSADSLNIFERLFRYPTKEVQPFENQLTEAFAILFERVTDFRTKIWTTLTGASPHGNIFIRTQAPYCLPGSINTKFIDVEIWEGSRTKRSSTYFIEVKAWSAESFSHNESNGAAVKQSKNYQDILNANKEYFGNHIGLFALTPRLNPLNLIESESTKWHSKFVNLFWDEVGDIISELRTKISNPEQQFLLNEFYQYLEANHIMIDKNITNRDFDIFNSYLEVKEKFWVALQPVAALLKGLEGPKHDMISFASASSQEAQDRFSVYRTFDRKKNLAIMAGFAFHHPGQTWVGAWIDLNPREADCGQKIAKKCLKTMSAITSSEDLLYFDDTWHTFAPEKAQWWVCARGRDLQDFNKSKTPLADITRFLIDCVKEAHSLVS